MGVLDLIRNAFRSPADRRLYAAAQAAEVWQSARQPGDVGSKPGMRAALANRPGLASVSPFGGGPYPPGRPPPINWSNDQMAPAVPYTIQPGYTDHTYQNMSAPYGFEGWDLCRIQNAVAAHSIGLFWESSLLLHVLLRFAPTLAALQQAIAPLASLPRHIHGGDKGIARLIARELEEDMLPARGHHPSVYLPSTLIPTLAITLRMMGAGTLQHVDGDPDAYTGVRPRFTRPWPEWGVNAYRSPRKLIALTTEGPVEIKNDGHFTRVQDEEEGYLSGAIVALGDQTFAGRIVQAGQLSFLDFMGKPKLWATLPEKVPTQGAAGDSFFAAIQELFGPDGFAALPYGSTVDTASLNGTGADKFTPAMAAAVAYIYMVLTGSTGTMGPGGPTGDGPYQAKEGGFWNVRHDLMERPIRAILMGINGGHVNPYCLGNYGERVAAAKRAGTWEWPRMTIPMVAPDRDARIAGLAAREAARENRIERRRALGILVDQPEADKIADAFEVPRVPLIEPAKQRGQIFEYHIKEKQVAPDEVREPLGLPPMPRGVGSVERLAEERERGLDKTGQTKVTEDPAGAPEDAGSSTKPTEPPEGGEEV